MLDLAYQDYLFFFKGFKEFQTDVHTCLVDYNVTPYFDLIL